MFAGSTRFRGLWTPKNTSPILWLDTADALSITTVSGKVSEWKDRSGNSRHVSQNTDDHRPAYTTNALNGLPVITFDGVSDCLFNNLFPTTPTTINLFVVARWTSRPWLGVYATDVSTLIDNNHSGSPPRGFVLQDRPDLENSPVTFAHIPNLVTGGSDTTTTGNNTWRIMNGLAVSGGNDFLWVDGTAKTTQVNGGAFNLQTEFMVGAAFAYGRFFNGQIAEIIVTDNSLHREKIEGYLVHKWGLTANLPSNHPFKNYPPRGA